MRQPRGIQHESIKRGQDVDLAAVSFALFILGVFALALFMVAGIGIEHISQTIGG